MTNIRSSPELENAYKIAVVNSMYGGVLSSAIPALAFTYIMIYLAFNDSPSLKQDLSQWSYLFCLSLTLNAACVFHWHRSANRSDPQYSDHWKRVYRLICLMMGLSMGYFFCLLRIEDQGIAFSYIALLVCCFIGTTFYTGFDHVSHALFLAPICLYLGANFWLSDFFDIYLVAVIASIATTQGFVVKSRKVLLESVELRQEKDSLLERLKEQIEISEQANLSKTKFLAAASHDLRQPLQSISLLLAALFTHLDREKQKDILSKARRSLDSLNELLESLLDISKLDAGVIHVSKTTFDLNALVTQEMEKQRASIEARNLTLSHNHYGESLIYSDPIILSRVLSNLISNAEKYTENGSIHVESKVDGDEVIIRVIDTGRGIPKKHQIDIFTEFVQLDNPERDRTKGLGLGLSIVKRLSSLLGGRIKLDSKVGTGSTFTLLIEKTSLSKSLEREPRGFIAHSNLRGLSILVIDDEITIRESMHLLLESWGCNVVTAADLDSAITKVREEPKAIDGLVVDFRLRNNTTGLDCIRAIRQESNREIPALLVTGDTAPERVKELENSGCKFIHKPIDPVKLEKFLAGLSR